MSSSNKNKKESYIIQLLPHNLTRHGLCSSYDEAQAIAEELILSHNSDRKDTNLFKEHLTNELVNFFDLSVEQTKKVIKSILLEDIVSSDSETEIENEIDNDYENYDNEAENENENEYIIEGECELCERYMKLTSHHLIPKSTWPKLKKKVFQNKSKKSHLETLAFLQDCWDKKNNNRQETLSSSQNQNNHIREWSRQSLHTFLSHYCCRVCRPCHSCIHSTHDNESLAKYYNTVDDLLSDKTIYKFCKWANKQNPGKYKY